MRRIGSSSDFVLLGELLNFLWMGGQHLLAPLYLLNIRMRLSGHLLYIEIYHTQLLPGHVSRCQIDIHVSSPY